MVLRSAVAGEAVLSQGDCSFRSLASNHACLIQDLALGTQPEGKEGSLLFFGRTLIKTGFLMQAGAPLWPPHEVGDGQQSCPTACHPLPVPRSFWGKFRTREASHPDSWLCQSLFPPFSNRSHENSPSTAAQSPAPVGAPSPGQPLVSPAARLSNL